MAGFQFTPMGIVQIGAPVPDLGDNVAGAAAPVALPKPEIARAQAERPASDAKASPAKLDPTKPMTGKQLVAMARARLRELDRIMPALERERAELRALLANVPTRRRTKAIQ